MNIQEYQAKRFFKEYSIPVLNSRVCKSVAELEKAFKELDCEVVAVKAQVLAGGRGQAGGVRIVKGLAELKQAGKELLGKNLVTAQTDSKGELIEKLLVEEGVKIKKEYYLSLLVDPSVSKICFVVSQQGGVDIEEIAEKDPSKIFKQPVDLKRGLLKEDIQAIAEALDLKLSKELENLCLQLYRLFLDKDASLIEINPLIETESDDLIALDAKMGFDDNALFRHQDLQKILKEENKDISSEISAKYGFSFVKLEGSLACMVNGAGLAMATMDIIKFHGGEPANFLDVGGSASEEKIRQAFELLLSFPEVKALLVNIFGGIMKCDVIARGLLEAVKNQKLKVPLVVRLEGTNSDKAQDILKNSGLNIITTESFDEAAKKAVEVVNVNTSR